MKITRRRDSTGKNSVITLVLAKKIADYASLYALDKGISRASIHRELITDWYEDQSANVSEEDLLDNISEMLYKVWQTRKRNYKDFEQYQDHVEDELIRRNSKINRKFVTIIMNNLHDLYAKEVIG
jgi:hypothetical protein